MKILTLALALLAASPAAASTHMTTAGHLVVCNESMSQWFVCTYLDGTGDTASCRLLGSNPRMVTCS